MTYPRWIDEPEASKSGFVLPGEPTKRPSVILVVSLSADNLNSLERYGLNAFPLVLALATITDTSERDGIVTTVAGGGLVALCGLALLGQYVP